MQALPDGSEQGSGGGIAYLSPEWVAPHPGAVELCRSGWKAPFAYVERMEEWDPVETSLATVDVYVLQRLYLSHAATLFLLGGGTLVQLFDGSLLMAPTLPVRSKPLFLALSARPNLSIPPPFIERAAVCRVRSLRDEATKGDGPSIEQIRSEVSPIIFNRGLFNP